MRHYLIGRERSERYLVRGHAFSAFIFPATMRAASIVLRAAPRRGGVIGRMHRVRSRGQQIGDKSRSPQELIVGFEQGTAAPCAPSSALNAAADMPVLPPHSDTDTKDTSRESLALASAPFEDKELKESAQVMRELILRTPQNEKHLIAAQFAKLHPMHCKVIKQHGGIKAVSKVLPHIYTFGDDDGGLTAPPRGPARDELTRLSKNTYVRTLCDAFILAGGSTAPMNEFERDQIDDEGRCRTKVVAIDTEGTHLTPPILVQVCPVGDNAINNKVYLEQPTPLRSQLSDALKDLLADESVLKVFFDKHGDLKSLGVPVHNILCLREKAGQLGHSGRLTPSLIDLFDTSIENGVETPHTILHTKNKTRQKWFRSRKRPTTRITKNLEKYGAADAWATARVYKHYVLRMNKEKASEGGGDGIRNNPRRSDGLGGQSELHRMASSEMQAELERRAATLYGRKTSGDDMVDEKPSDNAENSVSLIDRVGQYFKSFGV